MAVKIEQKLSKGQVGHCRALPVTRSLDESWWLYTGHLLTIFERSHSTILAHIAAGLIPPPDAKEGNRPIWKSETISKFLKVQAHAVKPRRARKKKKNVLTLEALNASLTLLGGGKCAPVTANRDPVHLGRPST